MTLDPKLKPVIEGFAALFKEPPHTRPHLEYRETAARVAAQTKPVVPAGLVVEDMVAEANGRRVPVRFYRPAGASGQQPTLMYMHGGGWVIDSVAAHDQTCMWIAAETPCTVVSVEYGLAPENPHPAPLLDCEAVTQWLLGNAAKLGVDPANLAVSGTSAGATLAAALCLKYRDQGGAMPFRLQVLLYPPMDVDFERPSYRQNSEGPILYTDLMKWFWQHYLQKPFDQADHLAVPIRAKNLKGLPPAYVATAEYDPLRDEAAHYAARLVEAGINVEYRMAQGQIHGFVRMRNVTQAAAAEFDALRAALQRAFA